MKQLKSACLDGLDATCVDVEATFTKGLPSFSIVGLANSSIQESKDRVKSALLTNEFKFPPLKITINLSPSDLAKSGTHFDLPIALLLALQNEKDVKFDDFFVFGELGLDGSLKDTKSIFVLILSLAQRGLVKNVLVPISSVEKISKIPSINVYSVKTLNQAIDFFRFSNKENSKNTSDGFEYSSVKVDEKKYYFDSKYTLDFADVKGQTLAKKAALIASAGNHNILFEGSPGCGKSMITKRLQYILPPMSLEEILEKAKLDSLDVVEPDFSPLRVFRNPHHSSTKASIFGGGSTTAKVGEVALSHNGLLFFDELPHFGKPILEALREPLEDHKILISRVNSKVNYPTRFMFVGALNPCPCGNLLSIKKECRCNEVEVKRYKNKLSDPFLDRMDLFVIMNEVNSNDVSDVTSAQLHKRVLDAFVMQKQRGQTQLNGKLNDEDINKYCVLKSESQEILDKAVENFALSFRGINKILKVSRTIADLNMSELIEKTHLLEALSYRKR
ncbi:MAG: YifB family Mg chelatase-like AAA ATPase [Campylobacteraceae bacterium]|nr:YifB family Mg chelatase-like AAA ATPase [Campylobacteraceae bacterium]